MTQAQVGARKIIRAPEVLERTGYKSRITLWRKSTDPNSDFPRPVQIGPNAVGWYDHEVDQYVANRPRCHYAR